MMISCSNCQAKIKVPDSAAGKKGKCPKCQTVITIPAAGEPSADDVPASTGVEAGGGSPFDFGDQPASPPAKRSKAAAADDEEVEDAADETPGGKSRKGKKQESIGLSVTSLVLGIVSLLSGCGGFGCCCLAPVSLLCALGALVTGFLGMKKGGAVMAYIGMGAGGLSLLIAIGALVLAFVGGGFRAFLAMIGAG